MLTGVDLTRHEAELGYFLHPDVWGRGCATEAARLLVAFGFDVLGLERITATCDPRNVASGHVLCKLGMRHETRILRTMCLADGWRDSDLYVLVRQDGGGNV